MTLIGLLNTSGTSGTTTTYPVTVLLGKTNRTLYNGAGATVTIQVGTKRNALMVPTSAVHTSVIGTTVNVYSGGKVTTTRVQTGIRGLGTTEVTSGLKSGDRVVLAVVSAPIPTSSSTSSVRRTGATLFGGAGGAVRSVGAGPA